MSLKKLILALTGVGLAIIGFTTIDFYIEQSKHNHPISQMPRMQATNEQKVVFDASNSAPQAPKITNNTNLPDNIPPAMLEAMKKQGISVEDLQGQSSAKGGMNGAFPKEMMEALEAQKQQNPQASSENAIVMKAMQHILSHNKQDEIKALQTGMDIASKDPANSENIIAVANSFIKHGEVKAAEIYLQKGIMATPTNATLYNLYGQVLSKDFQFEKAKEQWERSLQFEETAEVHYYLGMLFRYKLINEEEAKKHFTKANTLPTDNKDLKKHIVQEAGR